MIKRSIFIIFLSTFFLASCSTKSKKEAMEEAYNKEYCEVLVDSVLSRYMDYIWDSIEHRVYFKEEKNLEPMLLINGYIVSKSYGNQKLQLSSIWNILNEGNVCHLSLLELNHKDLGSVVSITGKEDYMKHIMDSAQFNRKIQEYQHREQELQQKKLQTAKEYEKSVVLANQNKTKVHFGISSADYYGFGIEYQKNFIDGLIGKGAYEFAKPIFGRKDKFVGFEIHSKHGKCCGHENILKYAELTKHRKLEGSIRFNSYESNYVSNLYNLQIFEQTDASSGQYSEKITVWWNSYLKCYD